MQEADAAGQLTAEAAALCAVASPGCLVASEAAQRLIARRFHCVAGTPDVERPAVVLGEREPGVLCGTALVGRDAERDALVAAWRRAQRGASVVVVVRGEAGIGKSRLVAALAEQARADGADVRSLRCSPHTQHTPFAPLLPLLAREGPDGGRLEEPGRAEAKAALLQRLRRPVGPPLVVVLEDLHWADPSTLEVLAAAAADPRGGGRLLVSSTRPDVSLPRALQGAEAMTLAPLGREEATALVRNVAGKALPPALEHSVTARGDGVPLFLEELALLLVEQQRDGGEDLRDREVPASLHDLLMARLDALGRDKRVAQLAAVLGRSADEELLFACASLARPELERGLEKLVEAGLASWRGGAVCFKHALVHEAAYRSLPRKERQRMHARVVEVCARSPAASALPLEHLARHLAAAGETRRAIDAWTQAGREATGAGANLEAIARYREALGLAAALPASEERDALELELQVALGAPLSSTSGYGAEETTAAFDRALALLRADGSATRAVPFEARYGLWRVASTRGGYLVARDLAEDLVHLCEGSADRCRRFIASYALGETSFWLGDFDAAESSLLCALDERPSPQALIERHAEDTRINALSMLAWTLFFQGRSDAAYARCDEAIALAVETPHPYSEVTAKVGLNALARFARDLPVCKSTAAEVLAGSRTHGFALWEAGGLAAGGWVLALEGEPSGIEAIEASIAIVRGAMAAVESFYLAMLGEAQLACGRPAQAASVFEETLRRAERLHERYYLPELERLHAEARAACPVAG